MWYNYYMKDNKWNEVWELYCGICIICLGKATCIHELVPRSKLPRRWNTIQNRIPLCTYCHNMIHQTSPEDYLDLLVMKRDILLQVLGKSIS